MKKFIISLLVSLFITLGATAQSGWRTGRIYAERGQTWTQWKIDIVGYDGWGNPIYDKICRQTYWHQKWYRGYVYVWGPNGWYTTWREGSYWYCTWGRWYRC